MIKQNQKVFSILGTGSAVAELAQKVLSMFVLDEKMTVASVSGSILILVGLIVSQKRKKIN